MRDTTLFACKNFNKTNISLRIIDQIQRQNNQHKDRKGYNMVHRNMPRFEDERESFHYTIGNTIVNRTRYKCLIPKTSHVFQLL